MNSTNKANRRIAIWCAIIVAHLALLYGAFRPISPNKPSAVSSTLFLEISRPAVKTSLHQTTPAPARSVPAERQAKQIEPQVASAKIEEAPPENIAKKEIDPFAITVPATGKFERNDRALGQIWKDLEKEHPVRRNLNPKITESKMQIFARQVLASSSASEVTMEQIVRADATKMTKVTTPHGVFCVVGPVPGRIHDIRGPEQRFMACPIEF